MKKLELARLLRENNYDYGFINKIIKNTFSDLKNFDLNLEIIKILLEQRIKIPDFLLKIIEFLFIDYRNIKFINFEINNIFKSYEYKNIFLSKEIQNYIGKINIRKINTEIKIKLFIFTLENYEKSIFTGYFLDLINEIYSLHKKEIFEYMIKTNFSFYEFYKIIYLLELPLNKYFSDLLSHGILDKNYNLNKNEIFEINKDGGKFLENFKGNEFETLIILIKDKYIEIDEKIFYKLENNECFFASIIFQKKFFINEKDNFFIDYLDKKIIEKKLHLNELEILENFKIDIFNAKIENILKIIERNYHNDFKNYLKNIGFKINFLQKYLEIYENIESNFIKNFFAEFIVENTINFGTLNEIFFLEKIDFLKNISFQEKDYFKKFYNYNFENETYENIIIFSILFFKYTTNNKYLNFKTDIVKTELNPQRELFILNMLNQNGKVKYCLIKAMKKFGFYIYAYDLKKVRRKTFFVRHFPINFYHFINYKILKK